MSDLPARRAAPQRSPGPAPGRLLLLGAGYCARALGDRLLSQGWELRGTTRGGPEGLAALAARGIEPYEFAPGRALSPSAWEGVTHVLSSIPPAPEGDPALDLVREAPQSLAWVGYLSSTGVYGDHQGAWVDEESDLRRPGSERARRRQAAEAGWRALALPWRVFRLSGIYGPQRGPLQRVLSGHARRLDAPHRFSRIHLEDIVACLEASLAPGCPGGIYNLCDHEPAPSAEVVAFACELLGREVPPLEPFDLEALRPSLASFYRDRRLVRSVRLEEELGLTLRYPTYREGLAAEVAALNARGS